MSARQEETILLPPNTPFRQVGGTPPAVIRSILKSLKIEDDEFVGFWRPTPRLLRKIETGMKKKRAAKVGAFGACLGGTAAVVKATGPTNSGWRYQYCLPILCGPSAPVALLPGVVAGVTCVAAGCAVANHMKARSALKNYELYILTKTHLIIRDSNFRWGVHAAPEFQMIDLATIKDAKAETKESGNSASTKLPQVVVTTDERDHLPYSPACLSTYHLHTEDDANLQQELAFYIAARRGEKKSCDVRI